MLRNVARVAGVAALTGALLTGCLSAEDCGGALGLSTAVASCAAGVEYDGRFYVAWSANLPVEKGALLGEAVYPACDDGNSGCGPDARDRPTQVWAMRGVDSDELIVGRMEGHSYLVVFGRLRADPGDYFRFAHGAWHVRRDPSSID